MSIQASFWQNKTLIKPEIEQKNINDFPFACEKPSLVSHNSLTNSPKKVIYETLNKNGSNEKELEIETNSLTRSESETKSNTPAQKNFKFNVIKESLNKKNSGFWDIINNGYYKLKILEFKLDNINELKIVYPISNCQNLYNQSKGDIGLYNPICDKDPMISNEFNLSKKAANKIYIPTENLIKNFYDEFNQNQLNQTKLSDTKQKTQFINRTDLKTFTNAEKKEEKEQYELANFNIPDNFLIKYNLKKIISKDLQTFRKIENPAYCIYLDDMEDFICNLCHKIVNKNENEKKINLMFDDEFIEYIKFDETDENLPFLQKKRSCSLDFDEIENINSGKNEIQTKKKISKKYNKKKIKKTSKKEKKDMKESNKKNGEKISLYLNQIEINDIKLENFPFFPLLGIRENIKVEFLKGIINKKNLIKVNKKVKRIKDQRNIKYIYNKKFELFFVNKENNKQYVLYINDFHILHLILYYYYSIQQGIKLINKYHYSHSSFEKSQKMTKQIESLIKKCNKIVENITC